MSERWGSCRSCRGMGKVKESWQDGVTGERTITERECGSCNGEGYSGDAFDDPKYLKDLQSDYERNY